MGSDIPYIHRKQEAADGIGFARPELRLRMKVGAVWAGGYSLSGCVGARELIPGYARRFWVAFGSLSGPVHRVT